MNTKTAGMLKRIEMELIGVSRITMQDLDALALEWSQNLLGGLEDDSGMQQFLILSAFFPICFYFI